ncbi:hypothetical protein MMC25_007130 [Agyrium rufum]|nr:hypothetical protein [Agyrium rufum]
MALNPAIAPSLTKFKLLSFDVFCTLIDEHAGYIQALAPLRSRLPSSHPAKVFDRVIIETFDCNEQRIQKAHPSWLQSRILEQNFEDIAAEWGIATEEGEKEAFGRSMGDWPAFPDTVAALQTLAKYYKLVVLSNVSKETFTRTMAGPFKDVKLDAIYVAEEIGSYKPDLRNFEYMFKQNKERFGVKMEEDLHVGHGLYADHVPAKKLGLTSAWIKRDSPQEEEDSFKDRTAYAFRWNTLGEMARDVEKAFAEAT